MSSLQSECAGCFQQEHAGSKTLHQQNPPVLSWRCRLTQFELYSGSKTVVVFCIIQYIIYYTVMICAIINDTL